MSSPVISTCPSITSLNPELCEIQMLNRVEKGMADC